MKIYLFCPTTGLYQGEDFADTGTVLDRRLELPPGATSIAPPPYLRGQVAVYLPEETRWEVRDLVRLGDSDVEATVKASPASLDAWGKQSEAVKGGADEKPWTVSAPGRSR